jgi:hypothetical protein
MKKSWNEERFALYCITLSLSDSLNKRRRRRRRRYKTQTQQTTTKRIPHKLEGDDLPLYFFFDNKKKNRRHNNNFQSTQLSLESSREREEVFKSKLETNISLSLTRRRS